MDEINLRGRIVSMYRTLDRFAKAIGWSRRKLSYIVNGKQEASASDIEKMCELLKVELPQEFHSLFLQ